MDVRHLEYFLAAVDHGSFNRAAASLYLSQPSLSQAIRILERDLGSELFHRIGRRVVLTEAGVALVEPARAAIRSMQLARTSVESVHGLVTGRLEIAAMPSQAVSPLTEMISRFIRAYPGVSVTVRAAFTAREVTEMVRTGAAELGILASAGESQATEVCTHPLSEQRFILLAPPDGPFPPDTTAVGMEDLAGHRLVVGQQGTGMRQYVDDLRAGGVDVTLAVETEHRVAILPLVLAGAGLAVVTEAWRELARQTGVLALDLEPPTSLKVALVSRHGATTPAAEAFLRTAAEDDLDPNT
ncbi:LysR family transcriptional regulator [Streptomyces chartreusis]|uniref:LysR family transcriptional regulator n=1 Tax=Streptomyces chartreusis TaxID=1969 RepID=UPI0036926E1D